MSEFQIFHNPRCSKSRQTLALLEENNVSPEIVLYLQQAPSIDELKALVKKLGVGVRDIIRNSEDAYKALNLADSSLSEQNLYQAIVDNPKLLQRPIVVKGEQAVIGRPPENVLTLLDA